MAKRSDAELRYAFWVRVVDTVGATIQTAVPWVCMVAMAGFFYLAIYSLSGRHTFADIGIAVLSDVKISCALAYTFGVGGILFGLKYKSLKADNVERTGNRIAELEKELDPGRSSSRLTSRGETRPGNPR